MEIQLGGHHKHLLSLPIVPNRSHCWWSPQAWRSGANGISFDRYILLRRKEIWSPLMALFPLAAWYLHQIAVSKIIKHKLLNTHPVVCKAIQSSSCSYIQISICIRSSNRLFKGWGWWHSPDFSTGPTGAAWEHPEVPECVHCIPNVSPASWVCPLHPACVPCFTLASNILPALFLQTKQLSPEGFSKQLLRGNIQKHSLSYCTNFHCLNVFSLPASFLAAFFKKNYSVVFSRWRNPRPRERHTS